MPAPISAPPTRPATPVAIGLIVPCSAAIGGYVSGGVGRWMATVWNAVMRNPIACSVQPKHGEPITANLATGVAVIADNTWAALRGREALKVEWTPGPFASESSKSLDEQCTRLLQGEGQRVRNDGDFDASRSKAARVVEAVYRVPFVSHCPMEPQNACADVRADSVVIVAPMQMPGGASRVAAAIISQNLGFS